MHYRNRNLFDIAVKLLIDFLYLFTLVCVIPWRRLSFCSIYLTLSILNFIRSPHALLSSTHCRALDACSYSMHDTILFRKCTFEDTALIRNQLNLTQLNWVWRKYGEINLRKFLGLGFVIWCSFIIEAVIISVLVKTMMLRK